MKPLPVAASEAAIGVLGVLIAAMDGGLSRSELGEFSDWLCGVAAGLEAEMWTTDDDHPEGW